MTLFPLVWEDAPPQIQETHTHRTLDSGEWTSEILEISALHPDREESRDTYTGYILSKK